LQEGDCHFIFFTGHLPIAWLYTRAGNLTDLELSDVPWCWRYIFVGVFVGFRVGVLVGVSVGVLVGVLVGFIVGVFVGFVVGVSVGIFVGVPVGLTLGVSAANGAAAAFMNEPIPRDKSSAIGSMTASK
jgi:hypothetical protein